MRRSSLVACLALLAGSWSESRAYADPIKLSIFGTAFGVPVNDTIDVSNGFNGATIPLTNAPIGAVYGSIAEGQSLPINSSISLQATLFDSTQNLASLSLTGPISGTLSHPSGDPDDEGSVVGTASPGSLSVFPGVAPQAIPDWLPGLSASVSGFVTGGGLDILQSSLSITPGEATPPPPVPEPGTLAIFMASACVVLGLRRYRRA
jgi:PEP-CTERM motif